MKAIVRSSGQMLIQITTDAMLFIICFVPFSCGALFKFGVPLLEKTLTSWFLQDSILQPYYTVFDLSLAILAPIMYCYVAAMVMLEEIDDGTAKYLAVTPLGKRGYLLSRLGFPAAAAVIASFISLLFFHLEISGTAVLMYLSFSGTVQGIIAALLIVSLSSNKLEGMAIAKMSGVFLAGVLAPFFIQGRMQYVMAFLPSFWMGKIIAAHNSLYIWIGQGIALIWIFFLSKKFSRKFS